VRPADDQLPSGCSRGQANKLLQQLYNEFAQGSPADGTGAAGIAVLKRCNNWSSSVRHYWSYLHRIIAAALAAAGGLAPEHKQLCQQLLAECEARSSSSSSSSGVESGPKTDIAPQHAAAAAVVPLLSGAAVADSELIAAASELPAAAAAAHSISAAPPQPDESRAMHHKQAELLKLMDTIADQSSAWPESSGLALVGSAAITAYIAGVLADTPAGQKAYIVGPWAYASCCEAIAEHVERALRRGVAVVGLFGYMLGMLLAPGMRLLDHSDLSGAKMLEERFGALYSSSFELYAAHQHSKGAAGPHSMTVSSYNSWRNQPGLLRAAEAGVVLTTRGPSAAACAALQQHANSKAIRRYEQHV
jgi:hypothetical protein